MLERMGCYTSLPLLALDEIERLNLTEWAREGCFHHLPHSQGFRISIVTSG
jgi:hypothetical protein